MTDIKGFGLWLLAIVVRAVVFFPAIILGINHSIASKNLGDYFYSLGSGIDVLGNKLIAPHANKYWVKPGGRLYGGNEHISYTMAFNKEAGFNTNYADKWERIINFFDRDHLKKSLSKNQKQS